MQQASDLATIEEPDNPTIFDGEDSGAALKPDDALTATELADDEEDDGQGKPMSMTNGLG